MGCDVGSVAADLEDDDSVAGELLCSLVDQLGERRHLSGRHMRWRGEG